MVYFVSRLKLVILFYVLLLYDIQLINNNCIIFLYQFHNFIICKVYTYLQNLLFNIVYLHKIYYLIVFQRASLLFKPRLC
jgi:hypothetical protein